VTACTSPYTATALVPLRPAFSDAGRLALAGFLAGYRGLTREAYALDVRQCTTWCRARSLSLFAVRRVGIEASPGTWTPVAAPGQRSFGGCAPSPGSAHTPSKRSSGAFPGGARPAAAGGLRVPCCRAGPPRARRAADRRRARAPSRHALVSLLALNGLRVFEATGAGIEQLGLERGHRTLTITRKGGKVGTIPLAPRTARAIDLAIGDRADGPVFPAAEGRRLDRHGAGRIVRKTARRAGIATAVTPRTLRHPFITAALDAGIPLRDGQEAASHADPRTTMRYDRARGNLDRHATDSVAAYVAGAAR
jgi:integrase